MLPLPSSPVLSPLWSVILSYKYNHLNCFGVTREGFKKKTEKVWSFAKLGSRGVSEGGEKPNCIFVRTALKVAGTPQILGERRPVSKNNKIIKRIDFEMGPSVKFVSPNDGFISEKMWSTYPIKKTKLGEGGCPREV